MRVLSASASVNIKQVDLVIAPPCMHEQMNINELMTLTVVVCSLQWQCVLLFGYFGV